MLNGEGRFQKFISVADRSLQLLTDFLRAKVTEVQLVVLVEEVLQEGVVLGAGYHLYFLQLIILEAALFGLVLGMELVCLVAELAARFVRERVGLAGELVAFEALDTLLEGRMGSLVLVLVKVEGGEWVWLCFGFVL